MKSVIHYDLPKSEPMTFETCFQLKLILKANNPELIIVYSVVMWVFLNVSPHTLDEQKNVVTITWKYCWFTDSFPYSANI